ncbi:hypothetical protein Taro_042135 [Colocasia esculenta]|uniref:Uncharacterized protein n=1 Tax=Colocasia esculenta TaxID=4460 RepID=A0A843WRY0_COLES|nr:hypothetical protein [Colocasia esculenta]
MKAGVRSSKQSRATCASECRFRKVERNLGVGPEISESGPGPNGSDCRFRIGPCGRFRSPGEEISTFYRSGTKIGVLVHTPRCGISGIGLRISRNWRLLDRLGETIPKSGHISDSDIRVESYDHFFRRRGTHASRWQFGRRTQNFAKLASSRPARRGDSEKL